MASLTRWTWVWVYSGSWWWTGRPGVLRFMGSQRVGHDWVTDLIWLANDSEHFFHIWTCHLCIFFGKVSFQVFCPFLKFCCLLSYCWILRVLCVFWITILYQMGLLQIFSFKSVVCLLILLIPSFAEQRFLILMKCSLSNFFHDFWLWSYIWKIIIIPQVI